MNNSSTPLESFRHIFANPNGGVLGLVDELLAAAREHGLQLEWKIDHCRLQFRNGGPPGLIEVPVRKSVFRAALARIAVLCNQRKPNSVSPYGGQGELFIGTAPATTMRVAFVNTPDEQMLELAPLRNESTSAIPIGECGDGDARSRQGS